MSSSLQSHELQHSRPLCPPLCPFSSVQSLSHVQLFVTQWNAARQASLSIINSQSLLKLMSIDSVMPSNYLILCRTFSSRPQSFPISGSFPISQFFASSGQSIKVSASALVLPMNIQGWFPLGLIGWISLQSKGLSRVFHSTTIWKHQLFGAQPSLWSKSHICTKIRLIVFCNLRWRNSTQLAKIRPGTNCGSYNTWAPYCKIQA